jgi:hypothetical protein
MTTDFRGVDRLPDRAGYLLSRGDKPYCREAGAAAHSLFLLTFDTRFLERRVRHENHKRIHPFKANARRLRRSCNGAGTSVDPVEIKRPYRRRSQ